MASFPVTAFRIEVAPNGGFISGTTTGGHSFDFVRVEYDLTAAIAAVLNGPNAEYDTKHKVFISSARHSHSSAQPLAVLKRTDQEFEDKTFNS